MAACKNENKSCTSSCQNRKVDFVREEYKKYKRKEPPPDFSDVVEFGNTLTYKDRVIEVQLQNFPCESKWLRCAKDWRVFGLKSCPGFLFIPNPFVPGAQRYWIERCVKGIPLKPGACNLDAHMKLEETDSVWEMSQSNGEIPDLITKLSWVHLGYKFDYNNVDYVAQKYYGFPEDLAELSRQVALAVGYPEYNPETGIVNYYPLSRSMGGHTDHYEEDLSYPLVSFSFGQSAVFLIGGKTRDIRPTALFIHSGDIVILSGESRLAFHAVPRIVKVSEQEYLKPMTFQRQPCEFHSETTERPARGLGVVGDFDGEEYGERTDSYQDGRSKKVNGIEKVCTDCEKVKNAPCEACAENKVKMEDKGDEEIGKCAVKIPAENEPNRTVELDGIQEVCTDCEENTNEQCVANRTIKDDKEIVQCAIKRPAENKQNGNVELDGKEKGVIDKCKVLRTEESNMSGGANLDVKCGTELTRCEVHTGKAENDSQGIDGCSHESFSGEELKYLTDYISKTRINVNIRQVHSHQKST